MDGSNSRPLSYEALMLVKINNDLLPLPALDHYPLPTGPQLSVFFTNRCASKTLLKALLLFLLLIF